MLEGIKGSAKVVVSSGQLRRKLYWLFLGAQVGDRPVNDIILTLLACGGASKKYLASLRRAMFNFCWDGAPTG